QKAQQDSCSLVFIRGLQGTLAPKCRIRVQFTVPVPAVERTEVRAPLRLRLRAEPGYGVQFRVPPCGLISNKKPRLAFGWPPPVSDMADARTSKKQPPIHTV